MTPDDLSRMMMMAHQPTMAGGLFICRECCTTPTGALTAACKRDHHHTMSRAHRCDVGRVLDYFNHCGRGTCSVTKLGVSLCAEHATTATTTTQGDPA